MTEEKSMKETLQVILPKIHNSFENKDYFRILPHEGKQDLEKSIPIKLRAWKDNKSIQYKFIIVRDKDSGNCYQIKENIKNLCFSAGREDVLIRIAIHELESWFFGDLKAIDRAYNSKLSKHRKTSKFRDPDKLANPSEELSKILNSYSKISWSKKISKEMDIENNSSRSFNEFVSGVRKII